MPSILNGPSKRMQFSEFLQEGTIIQTSPGYVLIGYGKRTWLPNPKGQKTPCFYSPDFFLTQKSPWFIHQYIQELPIETLLKGIQNEEMNTTTTAALKWTNPYTALFKESFSELQQRFESHSLTKAVPFVFESSSAPMNSKMLLQSIISALQYTQKHSVHIYGFWDKQNGILGATPELLFQIQNDTLKTMACGGTCRLENGQCSTDLLKDPKEMIEHQLVIEGIVESLSPFSKVQLGEIHVLKLTQLAHLITPINAQLKSKIDFESLVRALHPTPALGAAPRSEGMKWLQHYQTKIDRKRFGAPFGYFDPNSQSAHCLVAIRNAQWDSRGIHIGAGCGIVAKSLVEREWEEIQTKIKAVKSILAL